jgi:hypothetical protein
MTSESDAWGQPGEELKPRQTCCLATDLVAKLVPGFSPAEALPLLEAKAKRPISSYYPYPGLVESSEYSH